ncbi:MAG: dUTPase [Proteobacteria bacterium]|nr:dUTPase [Pseudomonadota bacterium]
MLDKIFEMQTELNDYVFARNKLKDKSGQDLSMKTIMTAVTENKLMVNDLPNEWLSNYSKAMKEELIELDEELLWKWWSKDEIDMQNIRVELIDILHFLVSAMMCAGLNADKVFDIYQQKHAVNLKRQESNYKKATKTEEDNKGIN